MTVFWSLVAGRSEAGRAACEKEELACTESQAELGLALIGRDRTQASAAALAGLLRYSLDAGVGEDYGCYVARRGSAMVVPLKRTRAAELRAQCEREVAAARATHPRYFSGPEDARVCATTVEIASSRRALLGSLRPYPGRLKAIDDACPAQ